MKTLSDHFHTAYILKLKGCSTKQIIERIKSDIIESDSEIGGYRAELIAKTIVNNQG